MTVKTHYLSSLGNTASRGNTAWLGNTTQALPLKIRGHVKLARLVSFVVWGGLLALQTQLCAQTLHTLDAIQADTKLISLAPDGQWSFAVGENKAQLAAEQIVRWGAWTGVLDDSAAWMVDDSLVCGQLTLSEAGVGLASDWLDVPPLSWNTIRGLVLSPPRTLDNWLTLQSQMQAVEGQEDVLWLADGSRLKGIVRWDDVSDLPAGQTLRVDVSAGDAAGGGDQTLRIPLLDIQAIVFSPALLGRVADQRDALWISLQDGSRLKTTRVDASPAGVQLALANGLQLRSLDFPEQFVSSIVGLARSSSAGVQFLSELSPASYRHLPDSMLHWELGVDRDVFGAALHARQGIFQHGLATHSVSQVAYRWDGSAARLLAEVRLATASPAAAERLGSVACQILVARGGQLQTLHTFELQRVPYGQAPPVELVDVALQDVRLIVLVTDKSDYGQYGDHVLWLDARLAPVEK